MTLKKNRNKSWTRRHIYPARNTSFRFLLHKYLQRKQEAEWKLLAAILIIVNTESSKCRWPWNSIYSCRTTDCQIYYTLKLKLLLNCRYYFINRTNAGFFKCKLINIKLLNTLWKISNTEHQLQQQIQLVIYVLFSKFNLAI